MRTKLNVLFSSQLKRNVYEIANQRKNVDIFFYRGLLEKFIEDKKIIKEINETLDDGGSYKNSKTAKIVFVIIDHYSYYEVESTNDIKAFSAISKSIMSKLNWKENLVFIINNKNVKKVPYAEQLQSLTKEILINNIDEEKQDNKYSNDNVVPSTDDIQNSDNIETKEEVNTNNNQDDIKHEFNDKENKNSVNGIVDDNLEKKYLNIENNCDSINNLEVEYEEVTVKKEESYKPKQVSPTSSQTSNYEYIENNVEKMIEKSKIDYDNIVWMNENNKHLFEGKEPKTRVVYLNQMNKNLSKVIEDNSSIDEYMLENNKIKIDME